MLSRAHVVLALGTICVTCLTEMGGRARRGAPSHARGAIREHFGFQYFAMPLCAEMITDLVVLSAEIGRICVAAHLLKGTGLAWWVLRLPWQNRGYIARWDQLDLSDEHRLKLFCPIEELKPCRCPERCHAAEVRVSPA